MEPVNPYQTPAAPPPVEAEAFRLMPGASVLRACLLGLMVAVVTALGLKLLPDAQPLIRSVFPALVATVAISLIPWLVQRKKRGDLRAAPPRFEGAKLLCAGLGRVKARGWLVKEVMIFVTSRALVLREKLEDSLHDLTIPFEQIATVEVKRFSLRVTRHDGQTQRIIVSHPRHWLQEIEAAQQGYADSKG